MRTCTTFMRTFGRCSEDRHVVAGLSPRSGRHERGLKPAATCSPGKFSLCVLLTTASAQLKPPVDTWPTYHGDYTGQRHSPLTQITPANVNELTQVWRFQTGRPQQIKASPIIVNGILYITTPDNLWAVDA